MWDKIISLTTCRSQAGMIPAMMMMMMMMKKTFYYNFLPTKAQEEAAQARDVPHQVSRVLVEVNDIHLPSPELASIVSPWPIRKSLSSKEILTERVELSHGQVFDHVFRYWTLETANGIVTGGSKCLVAIVDFTDEKNPRRHQSEHVYLEKGPAANESYSLRWTDLAKNRLFNAGDEIGLLWDFRSGCFHFKLLQRAT